MKSYKWKHKTCGVVSGKDNLTEVEVSRSLEVLDNVLWERIYDLKDYVARKCPYCHAPIIQCNHCGKKLPTLGMVPPKQWADFRVIYKGRHILVECKETNWKDKFPTHNVKASQIDFLVANAMAGGLSYLFICNRSRPPKLNCISIQDYLGLATLPNGRMKYAIPMEELDRNGLVIERTPNHGKPFYNLYLWTMMMNRLIINEKSS